MAVSPADVLSPNGMLEPGIIWPGLSTPKVTAKITAFIAEGAAKSTEAEDPDASTKLWVYYRAKAEQFERLSGMPSTVEDADEGSSSYLLSQIQMVKDARDGYLAEFEDSLAEIEGEDSFTTLRSLR